MKTNTVLGGFRKRDLPIAADYRPMYKIAKIICVLHIASSANKASLNKLHFFNWALKSFRNMDYVGRLLNSGDAINLISWGVEPALNKALLIAVAENLLSTDGDKYVLTTSGVDFYKKIIADKTLLEKEKEFLINIGKRRVSETFITKLTQKLSN